MAKKVEMVTMTVAEYEKLKGNGSGDKAVKATAESPQHALDKLPQEALFSVGDKGIAMQKEGVFAASSGKSLFAKYKAEDGGVKWTTFVNIKVK